MEADDFNRPVLHWQKPIIKDEDNCTIKMGKILV